MKAIVLLSGGLDSTVSLAYAISKGYQVVPLTILYGQRHSREVESAKMVARHYDMDKHIFIHLDLSSFRSSALTSLDVPVPQKRDVGEIGNDIPVTYVPARNIIFLSIAAGLSESEGAEAIFIGANSKDYSGYPDCRPEFFRAFEKTLLVGTKTGVSGNPVRIEHPLLRLTKADIVRLGQKLKAPLNITWSCYGGGEKACGKCDSCLLRLKGFAEAGGRDEIEYEE